MKSLVCSAVVLSVLTSAAALTAGEKNASKKKAVKTVKIGSQAPRFIVKTTDGKTIDLAKLTAKGPVLVRLTCGCSGCDKELAYFQALHAAYKGKGFTSLAIFREPDAKVEKYVKKKKLNMLYAVDTKGKSWKIFQTKKMPANFLIAKGGRIISIAEGCEPSGLIANILSKKVAKLLKTAAVDVQKKANAKPQSPRAKRKK